MDFVQKELNVPRFRLVRMSDLHFTMMLRIGN